MVLHLQILILEHCGDSPPPPHPHSYEGLFIYCAKHGHAIVSHLHGYAAYLPYKSLQSKKWISRLSTILNLTAFVTYHSILPGRRHFPIETNGFLQIWTISHPIVLRWEWILYFLLLTTLLLYHASCPYVKDFSSYFLIFPEFILPKPIFFWYYMKCKKLFPQAMRIYCERRK